MISVLHVELDKLETVWLDDTQMPGDTEQDSNQTPPSAFTGLKPWTKGQSGNPSGKPAGYAEVRAAADAV